MDAAATVGGVNLCVELLSDEANVLPELECILFAPSSLLKRRRGSRVGLCVASSPDAKSRLPNAKCLCALSGPECICFQGTRNSLTRVDLIRM